jgi:hypothetical protein
MPHIMYGVEPPKAGTQMAANMLTMVANPMGIVPKKSDCTGCETIRIHVAGYSAYLRTEIKNMTENTRMLRVKNAMLRALSEL